MPESERNIDYKDGANQIAPATNTTNSSSDSAASKKSWISEFLEWSKPYRELTVLLVSILAAMSGGVAWVVAHFATQMELHYLECRLTYNILTQILPIHMEEYVGKIDWRMNQIKVLAEHGGAASEISKSIKDLGDQVTSLTKEQQEISTRLQKDIDNISKQCISEKPEMGAK